MTFEEDHHDRVLACAALEGELFVKTIETAKASGEDQGEDQDDRGEKIAELTKEIIEEVKLRENFYTRLSKSRALMISADEARSEALSRATEAELKTALRTEFVRRNPEPLL